MVVRSQNSSAVESNSIDGVIVVGAGPVGLVAAMQLAAHQIPVLVLEAENEMSHDLRASTFHPPTLDMLADSGITDLLIEQGLVCPTWQIRMHTTGDKAVFDLSLIADETDHPYRLQCEQNKLCELLLQHLAGNDLVTIQFGRRVTQVNQGEHRVNVEVVSDVTQESTVFSAPFVIGADGASSQVRQSLGFEFIGTTYAETTVLVSTTFAFHDYIDDLSNVTYCWSQDGNFALLRLKDFWRCSLYYDPDLTFDEAMTDSRVQAQLHAIHPHSEPFLIVDKRPYRVHQRIVDDYRAGRVLLVGDAAHVNSPSGGMGMNGGIHDAFNLADTLASIWHGADIALLDRYTRQRRPVAEVAIMQQADRNRKRMTQKDPVARARSLAELQKITNDRKKAHAYLLQSSMIEGLRHAATIA